MKSTEEKNIRLEMLNMHDFFLNKINVAIKEKNHIEASWLIYACMENRFFRTLQKYKKSCNYCKGNSKCKKSTNQLALSTKIACIQRLSDKSVNCISDNFSKELLVNIKNWVKRRNTLMHDLLSLETYNGMDKDFEKSASEGLILLNELYDSCTKFRASFYNEEYEFIFPQDAMDGCSCKPKEK